MGHEPLVHIGYHKTGTTWLQNRVFPRADLGFAKLEPRLLLDRAFVVQNPFWFDLEGARRLVDPFLAAARRRGQVPVLSHERLSGLPLLGGGLDAPLIADRLHAALPDARILVVVREQRDMLLSLYKHYVFALLGTERLEHLWRERTIRERRSPGPTLEVFEYHHLIEHYRARFGGERVLVLPYELLKRDARGFVARIASFVGLDAPMAVDAGRDNAALPAGAVVLVRGLNVLTRGAGLGRAFQAPDRPMHGLRLRVLRRLAPMVPGAVSRRVESAWRARIDRLAGGRFRDSNRITSALIGLDLGSLGWDVGDPAGPSRPGARVPARADPAPAAGERLSRPGAPPLRPAGG